MFTPGMVVKAKYDVRFAKKGDVAEVFQDYPEDEVELDFGKTEGSIPAVYFNFEDFEVLHKDVRFIVECTPK